MSELSLPTPAVYLPPARAYPERHKSAHGWQRAVSGAVAGLAQRLLLPWRERQAGAFVAAVNRHGESLRAWDANALVGELEDLRGRLRRENLADEPVARAFALVRRVAAEAIGLTHYDVQIRAAYGLLHGQVAELETGEGKTLTATLAAATAALAGTHVHVITVNDYLARRDRESMGPLYEALGLSVGLVTGGMAPEQRRLAYQAHITYCTNKEVAFDYLRDRMTLENNSSSLRLKLGRLLRSGEGQRALLLRGLEFAIVDEADSVLIDEARTPLIISERTDPELERRRAERALDMAGELVEGRHFSFRGEHRRIELTAEGEQALERLARDLPGSWRGRLYREEQARNALAALHVFHRDRHYLVRNDRIEIIDENTGRVMPDRSWGEGIQQMIEVKERCTVTGQTMPLAQMTYQRFFRRYRKLAGMTGTAMEARSELWSVYRLPVMRIATHRPLIRHYRAPQIFATADDKWQHIAERARKLAGAGVPVLIGTRSVASSEVASACLTSVGVEHRVLNAAQDQHEAAIIAEAGQAGRVTVATNMAGRGVDIRVDPEALARGGLHIIMSERHDSGRIDRQLFGRCARQGEPGTVEICLSLEDSLLVDAGMRTPTADNSGPGPRRIFDRAQRIMESRHLKVRRDLMRWEEQSGTVLAFAGMLE